MRIDCKYFEVKYSSLQVETLAFLLRSDFNKFTVAVHAALLCRFATMSTSRRPVHALLLYRGLLAFSFLSLALVKGVRSSTQHVICENCA